MFTYTMLKNMSINQLVEGALDPTLRIADRINCSEMLHCRTGTLSEAVTKGAIANALAVAISVVPLIDRE